MPNKSCIYSIILIVILNNIHSIPFYFLLFKNSLIKSVIFVLINQLFIHTIHDLIFILHKVKTLMFKEGNYKNSFSRFLIVFSIYFILEAYYHTLVPYQVVFYIWFLY